MERKFTDDEILKALECICGNVLFCADCPYSKTFNQPMRCKEMCAKDALDLINRQKAEIEELTKLLRSRHRAIEHLEGVIVSLPDQVRAEAIKEFAERLKQYCAPGGDFGDPCGVLTVTDRWVDHLVKEMTGEDNGN